ncbi:hypothetical protein JB92DRAFT_3116621 [Gautieria morchelliformis]|nr:hypothetical protein JB92DRAFT_3116621 [Gautieria morchelliformis]
MLNARDQEIEPFQDTIPPRHQVESDESDEDIYPSSGVGERTAQRSVNKVVVHLKGPQEKRQPLVVVLGEAGRQWAKGTKLGEVKGRVLIDNIEVASVSMLSPGEVTIVDVNVRLPIYTTHAVASTVISAMRPTQVVIIDGYPLPSYISPSPSPLHPPIRYLRTTAASKHMSPPDDAEPFHPPNLIQSLAASFLTILESSTHDTPATLLLLPSTHIPPPAPSELGGRYGPEPREEWEPSILARLHKMVGCITGLDSLWSVQHLPERSTRPKASRIDDIGEGGMYI